jgi:hypothetical protein
MNKIEPNSSLPFLNTNKKNNLQMNARLTKKNEKKKKPQINQIMKKQAH